MTTSRRDFMKLVGISMASLLLTRCRGLVPMGCYAPIAQTAEPQTDRDRLRACWLRFDELAQRTASGNNGNNDFGQELSAVHRAALDDLVAAGELSPSAADLIQEAYGAAIYHVWRMNTNMTCYEPILVDYAPASAGLLVQQSEILGDLDAQGAIDPGTLANAQAALEHDLAYFALSDADEQALYDQILKDYNEQGRPIPSFDALQLEISPEARSAARYIVDLLAGK